VDFLKKPGTEEVENQKELPEEPVEAWLNRMIAQAKPELKDLRNLGGVAPEIPCDTCPQKVTEPLPREENLWSANTESPAEETAKKTFGTAGSAPLIEPSEEEMIAVVLIVEEQSESH